LRRKSAGLVLQAVSRPDLLQHHASILPVLYQTFLSSL
jgi:hypothetical protein